MNNNDKNSPQGDLFECAIADKMKFFTRILNVTFSIALIITAVMALIVFAIDIYTTFTSGNIASGTTHALGSLLILWTLSELLSSEIRRLRGEKMKVTIFIEVAIAAFVRKLLVLSTEGITMQEATIYLASLLILGLVYWLLQSKYPNSSH